MCSRSMVLVNNTAAAAPLVLRSRATVESKRAGLEAVATSEHKKYKKRMGDHDRQTLIAAAGATREGGAGRPRRSPGRRFHPSGRRSRLHTDAGGFRRRSHQDRE